VSYEIGGNSILTVEKLSDAEHPAKILDKEITAVSVVVLIFNVYHILVLCTIPCRCYSYDIQ
jgi:hypothetical protein